MSQNVSIVQMETDLKIILFQIHPASKSSFISSFGATVDDDTI